MKELIETWQVNNRRNIYLHEAIDETNLTCISVSKGRTVGKQFPHIYNVRLMWLKASMPDLLQGQTKIEMDNKLTKKCFLLN